MILEENIFCSTTNIIEQNCNILFDFPQKQMLFDYLFKNRSFSKQLSIDDYLKQSQHRGKKLVDKLTKIVIETDAISMQVDKKGFNIINQYQLQKKLGQGSFGTVYLAVDLISNKYVAIKQVSRLRLQKIRFKNPLKDGKFIFHSMMDNLKQEISIMKKLNHFNCIQLLEVIEPGIYINVYIISTDKSVSDSIYLVLEYAQKGQIAVWVNDQQQFITQIPIDNEKDFRPIVRQLVKALFHLHSKMIIHKDIKPMNILLDQKNNIKLSDFGLASYILPNCQEFSLSIGTLQFMAPENFKIDQDIQNFNFEQYASLDIWSLGVTLYSIYFKKLPFFDKKQDILIQKIQEDKLEFPQTPKIANSFKNFLSKLIEKDPSKRYKMSDILKDNWLNKDSKITLIKEIQSDNNVSAQRIKFLTKLKDPIFTICVIKLFLRKIIRKIKLKYNIIEEQECIDVSEKIIQNESRFQINQKQNNFRNFQDLAKIDLLQKGFMQTLLSCQQDNRQICEANLIQGLNMTNIIEEVKEEYTPLISERKIGKMERIPIFKTNKKKI